jgi:hypothetical protein
MSRSRGRAPRARAAVARALAVPIRSEFVFFHARLIAHLTETAASPLKEFSKDGFFAFPVHSVIGCHPEAALRGLRSDNNMRHSATREFVS